MMGGLSRLASIFIVLAGIIAILIIGKPFLVPIFLAIVVWYLINAMNQAMRLIPIVEHRINNSITLVVSSVFILIILASIGTLIVQNVNNMIANAPDYKVNLDHQLSRLLIGIGYTKPIDIDHISSELDLNKYLLQLLNTFSASAQRFLLISIYVIFLLIEQSTFTRKLASLRLSDERKAKLAHIFKSINKAVRTYIGVKFAASVMTGLLSYFVMLAVGLDYALFWGFLIFVLNFIPTIGSIIATIFPALVALIQFETLTPFFIILAGIGLIQIIIGGILEPRLYGNSLNISPFVILISLFFWGLIWGIVGMLLCIPITVILIIIFAQFPQTRPISVMLSRNGRLGAIEKV